MRTPLSKPIVGALLVVAGGVTALGFHAWSIASRSALFSCVASIARSVQELPASELNRIPISDSWRVLTDPESDQLLLAAKPYDCAGRRDSNSGVVLDPWGRRFRIAVRWEPSGDSRTLHIRAWSKGRDGRSATDDDEVVPYGERAIPAD